jgi:hypothetical protein
VAVVRRGGNYDKKNVYARSVFIIILVIRVIFMMVLVPPVVSFPRSHTHTPESGERHLRGDVHEEQKEQSILSCHTHTLRELPLTSSRKKEAAFFVLPLLLLLCAVCE